MTYTPSAADGVQMTDPDKPVNISLVCDGLSPVNFEWMASGPSERPCIIETFI